MPHPIRKVRFSDIEQGTMNSCVLLSLAPDNLLFQKLPKGKVAFQFRDRLTGIPEWITVKAGGWRSSPRSSSIAIEKAYGKWLRQEGIYDIDGLTGLPAVANGNKPEDVVHDITGRTTAPYDPNEAIVSPLLSVVVSGVESRYFALNHAYRVLGVSDGIVTLKNPWGYDGREIIGADDGILTMSRAQFSTDFVGWGYSF